ncbi:hypothetical protein WOLCODRAFT_135374 [Wolfiporia cocos MD-104 SS10]|uniref:Deoxycytidylate deaminase n=1 Tax=Wolfiporia cocos (strain MD-104) TaxID=742152 RepID=A0A2H3J8B9_WOLCO|nr:hypothetical protein WOLCODRAFT_135374 [Wolfiporia cocos MD-104 SS10]
MFIAIVGTRFAGKSTLEEYLVNRKGFTQVRVNEAQTSEVQSQHTGQPELESILSGESEYHSLNDITPSVFDPRMSFLTMVSPPPSALPSPAPDNEQRPSQPLSFASPSQLLHYVTKNWRMNFVTCDLNTKQLVAKFVVRPFFMIVHVDAPVLTRYRRAAWSMHATVSLEDFVRENDVLCYGKDTSIWQSPRTITKTLPDRSQEDSLLSLASLYNLNIINSFDNIPAFHNHLEGLNLLDQERLRPGWDAYFMQLASLASQRSNCMKRRVGAILVRNKRILATGYNGTPRGLKNCNEGGCIRCNNASDTSDECVCLHAEENALLEAGRERVGDGAVLYCNTCPCLKCTIKIIQTGIKEVVYNLSYKVDDASAELFHEAGVIIRRHATLA